MRILDDREVVNTTDALREVWERIGDFESQYFASNLRNARISNTIVKEHCDELSKNINMHNSAKEVPKVEPLAQIDATDDKIVREITNNARQARDFFSTSKTMPMLSKPIILHYAFEKLADVMILNTFKITGDTYAHGLGYDEKLEKITVEKKGLFARLHCCYSTDVSFCAKGYEFKLDSLLNANPINEHDLFEEMRSGTFGSIPVHEETTNSDVTMPEPDREFLFIFALSSLARYHVNEWSDIIEGANDARILKIRRYIQSIQAFFPNWLLNALHTKKMFFYSVARLG
jgi:hypothetical protein